MRTNNRTPDCVDVFKANEQVFRPSPAAIWDRLCRETDREAERIRQETTEFIAVLRIVGDE